MATFLNINLDEKTPNKFIWKHILFSFIWITGVLIVFFRIDIIALNNLSLSLPWFEGILPILLFIISAIVIIFQEWYYTLAFVFYPILAVAWFIPKQVLKKGKIYLFTQYLNSVFSFFQNLKRSLFYLGLFGLTMSLLFIITATWSKWLALFSMSYFFGVFIYRHLKKSFQPAQLFGSSVEVIIESWKEKGKKNESFLLETFVQKGVEESLEKDERKQKHLKRVVIINYILETLSQKLNSFNGKKAYIIYLMYELFMFFLFSILFLWFINFELFKIDPTNFQVIGEGGRFDFFYYTLKTITFSESDAIKPYSIFAKSNQILSFLIIGILFLILLLSLIFALRQDKINENIKLTTDLCNDQNRIINEFLVANYGTDIQNALIEVTNISESLKKLKKFIDKMF